MTRDCSVMNITLITINRSLHGRGLFSDDYSSFSAPFLICFTVAGEDSIQGNPGKPVVVVIPVEGTVDPGMAALSPEPSRQQEIP